MSLKKVTLIAIIGITYIFVSRTIGTILPVIFRNLWVAQVSGILSLLAGLTVVVFYFSFYKNYVQKGQQALRNATLLVIIGSFAGALLYLQGLLLIFNIQIYTYPEGSGYFEVTAPWISSIFSLLFFIAFYRETLHKVRSNLSRAALLAVAGFSVAALIRTFILFNYFYLREFMWFADLSGKTLFLFMPIYLFIFLTAFYFFLSFYKELE